MPAEKSIPKPEASPPLVDRITNSPPNTGQVYLQHRKPLVMTNITTPSGFLEWMDSASTLWRDKDKLGLKKSSIDVLKPVLPLLSSEEEENLKKFVSICLTFNPDGQRLNGECMICEHGVSAVESLSRLPDEPPKIRALVWVVDMANKADVDDTIVTAIATLSKTADELDNSAWKALTWAYCASQQMNGFFTSWESQQALGYIQAVDDWLDDNEFPQLKIFNDRLRDSLQSITGGRY